METGTLLKSITAGRPMKMSVRPANSMRWSVVAQEERMESGKDPMMLERLYGSISTNFLPMGLL